MKVFKLFCEMVTLKGIAGDTRKYKLKLYSPKRHLKSFFFEADSLLYDNRFIKMLLLCSVPKTTPYRFRLNRLVWHKLSFLRTILLKFQTDTDWRSEPTCHIYCLWSHSGDVFCRQAMSWIYYQCSVGGLKRTKWSASVIELELLSDVQHTVI